jgi:signal transduction histidine kinase/DNA-binding response OmpR family regulator
VNVVYNAGCKQILLLIFLLVMTAEAVTARGQKYHIKTDDHVIELSYWTHYEGLPSWLISSLYSDSRGFIWMSSLKGLTRFDGKNFVTYSPLEINLHNISAIVGEDVKGNLWLTAHRDKEDFQVIIFNTTSRKFQSISEYTLQRPYQKEVIHHYCLKNKIYLQTSSELWSFDGSWNLEIRTDSVRGKLHPAGKNGYWYSEKGHQLQYKNKTGDTSFYYEDLPKATYTYFLDNKRRLWAVFLKGGEGNFPTVPLRVLSNGGIDSTAIYTVRQEEWLNIPAVALTYAPQDVNGYSYHFDQQGKLSISHHGKTAVQDLLKIIEDRFGIKADRSVFHILEKDKGIWLITRGGLLRINARPNYFKAYKVLSGESLRQISSVGDDLIVNTNTGPYYLTYNSGYPSKQSFIRAFDDRANAGLGIFREQDTIWMGLAYDYILKYTISNKKIAKYHLNKDIISHYDGYAFYRQPDGKLLIGTHHGILYLNERTRQLERYALKDTLVYFFYPYKGQLWAGTNKGVLNLTTGQKFFTAQAASQPRIFYHLMIDEEGVFWFATDRGVWQCSPDFKKVRLLGREFGLTENRAHYIYQDKMQRLWISSDDGLYSFEKRTEVGQGYFEQDGLPNNECNYLAHFAKDGQLFIGTVNGLFSFEPDKIPKTSRFSSKKTEIISVAHQKNGNIVDGYSEYIRQKHIAIKYGYSQTTVSVCSPYFGHADISFEWSIPGLFDQWQKASDGEILLYNLPYGEHELLIRNQIEGLPNNDTSAYKRIQIISVRPFFFRWWFIVLMALIIGAIIHKTYDWRRKTILEINRELEGKVALKTKELNERNKIILHQSTEIMKQNNLKTRFFAHINHELRTPLTIILGYIQKLKSSSISKDEQEHVIEKIERNTNYMNVLTQDMLEFVKLDQGAISLQYSQVSWQSFLDSMLNNFRGIYDEKGVELIIISKGAANEDNPLALDVKKVERILSNLLFNALKFTNSPGKVILESVVESAKIKCSVEDTGVGISEDDLRHIFERFYQSSSHTNSSIPGFGIGLSMCKEYIDLMEGEIHVESKPGKGSKFTVILPIKNPDSIGSPPETKKVYTNHEQARILQIQKAPDAPAHILIAEDNSDLQDYLAEMLEDKYHLTVVSNGKQALDLLIDPSQHFDLLITDIMMPEMDGLTLIQNIRKQEDKTFFPCIILTALDDKSKMVEGLHLGVESYVVKPFLPEELIARINNLLRYREDRIANAGINGASEDVLLPESYQKQFLLQLDLVIERRMKESELKIKHIADEIFLSERTLRNRIRAYTGISPSEYIVKKRLEKALLMMENKTHPTISEICYEVGFKNTSHFTKIFKSEYGKSPSEYL